MFIKKVIRNGLNESIKVLINKKHKIYQVLHCISVVIKETRGTKSRLLIKQKYYYSSRYALLIIQEKQKHIKQENSLKRILQIHRYIG